MVEIAFAVVFCKSVLNWVSSYFHPSSIRSLRWSTKLWTFWEPRVLSVLWRFCITFRVSSQLNSNFFLYTSLVQPHIGVAYLHISIHKVRSQLIDTNLPFPGWCKVRMKYSICCHLTQRSCHAHWQKWVWGIAVVVLSILRGRSNEDHEQLLCVIHQPSERCASVDSHMWEECRWRNKPVVWHFGASRWLPLGACLCVTLTAYLK